MNKKNIITFVVIFLLLNLVINFFTKKDDSGDLSKAGNFGIATTKNEYGLNEQVAVKIRNNTVAEYKIADKCPAAPLDVEVFLNGQWTTKTAAAEIKCGNPKDLVIKPQEEITVHFQSWNHTLFGEIGKYKLDVSLLPVSADAALQPVRAQSNEFDVKEEGLFGFLWTAALYQPIYNTLIFIVSVVPWHDLGLAIILLTILIRTILLIPSQKALKSQRKLQEIQPKLNKIKEKYKDNQEMIAKETMLLWKEHKVNPFGSCLPLLIQFPVLIALFYVIQNGLNPDNAYLLYGSLGGFSLSKINVIFLGILDLTAVNAFVLPLFVGGLQFLQMKLAVLRNEKKKEGKAEEKKEAKNEMETANQMMIYVMPVMIAVFTASVPAGVGLYWAVSTLYGIIQQVVVNRQVSAETATVRVIKSPNS
jgi:YidC/Oxa1 family membrane protein insertase